MQTDQLGNRVYLLELRVSLYASLSELGPLKYDLDVSLFAGLHRPLHTGVLANLWLSQEDAPQ